MTILSGPALSIVSAASGVSLPFTFGHAFKKGDVPAGQTLQSPSVTNFQCVIKNAWPDGSAKFAILSGYGTLTGGTSLPVTLDTTAAGALTGLTTANLKATGVTVTLSTTALGSASWTNADWDTPFQLVVSGPTMTSWLYRKFVGTDNILSAWLEVRLYSNGQVEILPWLENGYLKVAGASNKNDTYTLSIGGTQVFSRMIDVKHRTRPVLIADDKVSYWFNAGGSDPVITPVHNQAYLQLTELVPTYMATITATAPVMTLLPTTFVPYQIGSLIFDSDNMASTGYQRPIGIIPEHDVAHLTCPVTSIPTVYLASQRNGYSSGRYSIHYRDENTNRPFRFSQYPTLVIPDSQGFKDVGGSTVSDYTTAATGASVATWDIAHSPSLGFYPYLLTGRYFFLEQAQFAATVNYLGNGNNPQLRDGSKCLMRPCVGAWQTRSCAWQLRTHVQALTITPDDDTVLRNEFLTTLNNNIDWFYQRYVQQKNNPFGCIIPGETYGPMSTVSPWQQDFITHSFGYTLSLDLPLSAAQATKLARFFQWKAKFIVGRLGSFATGGFPAVNADVYKLSVSSTATPDWEGGTGPWRASWDEIWSVTPSTLIASPFAPNDWLKSVDGVLGGEIMPGARSFWGNMMPALSYAVRWGVPGAQEGLARLQSASNWPALVAEFNTFPVWSVKPPNIAPAAVPGLGYTGSTTRIRKPAEFVGKTHVGSRGSGVLGSVVRATTATGTHGPGAMYEQLPDTSDDNVEVSLEVTQLPSSGKVFVYNDGSYIHSGASDGTWTWKAQLKRQGQDVGAPITVTDTIGVPTEGTTPFTFAVSRATTSVLGSYTSSLAGSFAASSLARATTAVTGSFSSQAPGDFTGANITLSATAVSGSFTAFTQGAYTGTLTKATTAVSGSYSSSQAGPFTSTLVRASTEVSANFTSSEPAVFSASIPLSGSVITASFTSGTDGSGFTAALQRVPTAVTAAYISIEGPTLSGHVMRGSTGVSGSFQSFDDLTRYIDTSRTGLENLVALINADNGKAGRTTTYTAAMFRVRLIQPLEDQEWNSRVTLEGTGTGGFTGVYDTKYNRMPLGQTLAQMPAKTYAAVYGETKNQVLVRILARFGIAASAVDSAWVDFGPWNTAATHTLTITPSSGDLNLLYLPGTSLVVTVTTPGLN